MEDEEIIQLYFARNQQAIKETEQKYGKLCLRIAKNLLSSPEDAEECVNDTYLALWDHIPPAHPAYLASFICKVTRNLSLKKLEHTTAQKRSPDAVISLSELSDILPDSSMRASIESRELGQLISAFLWGEKEEVRNVFIRKYWFFDSVGDIAKRYSYSESKVKSMLLRTRSRLKKYLMKEGIAI